MAFVHLHNHSDFSILDAATRIPDMVKRAVDLQMPALALTDHGYMFGVPDFDATVGDLVAENIDAYATCPDWDASYESAWSHDLAKKDALGAAMVAMCESSLGVKIHGRHYFTPGRRMRLCD